MKGAEGMGSKQLSAFQGRMSQVDDSVIRISKGESMTETMYIPGSKRGHVEVILSYYSKGNQK